MIAITVRPIKKGAISLEGRPTLQSSVRREIMVTNRKVPTASMRKPLVKETSEKADGYEGLGKYSPNIIAVLTESAVPRII
jgi:hypothetical protein